MQQRLVQKRRKCIWE